MSAPEAAPIVLRPAPLGDGTDSRCQVYLDEVAPLNSEAQPPPGTDADLVEWIDLLRQHPIRWAAGEFRRRTAAPTTPIPATLPVGPRHRAPDAIAPVPAVTVPAPSRNVPSPLAVDEPDEPDDLVQDSPVEEPAAADDEAYIYEPVEGQDYQLDKKGRRVFDYFATEGNAHVAVDADGNHFTDEDGDFIYTSSKGVADRGGNAGALLDKARNLIKSGGASTAALSDDLPALFDENGAPVEHFPVPEAGRALGVVSEKAMGGRRLAFAVCAASVVGIGGLLIGTVWGRSAVPAEGAISSDEVSTFRLSTLPVNAMSAFGQQYLQTCLTHGDKAQMKARAALLAQMSTGGAAQGCGWTEGGEQQEPLSIAFTGRYKPIEGTFNAGSGAYLDFLVSTRAGQFSTYTVPVWIKSSSTSDNMTVVGEIGKTPGIQVTQPTEYDPGAASDPALASDLQANLVKPYLTAWAASDRTQIDLAVASDASANATRGLQRTVKTPEIISTLAYSPAATGDGQKGSYSDGDTATLVVTVTWTVPASAATVPDSTQTVGYRIEVIRTGGKWLVTDIRGGAVTPKAAQDNSSATSGLDADSGIGGVETTPSESPEQTTAANNELAPSTSAQP